MKSGLNFSESPSQLNQHTLSDYKNVSPTNRLGSLNLNKIFPEIMYKIKNLELNIAGCFFLIRSGCLICVYRIW